MTRPSEPRWCRDDGCDIKVILARRAFTGTWAAYEATDRPPFSMEAAGCHVVVAGQAWKPADLIEDFMTRYEISEAKARELVEGYPFHRPHFHEPADSTTQPDKEGAPA